MGETAAEVRDEESVSWARWGRFVFLRIGIVVASTFQVLLWNSLLVTSLYRGSNNNVHGWNEVFVPSYSALPQNPFMSATSHRWRIISTVEELQQLTKEFIDNFESLETDFTSPIERLDHVELTAGNDVRKLYKGEYGPLFGPGGDAWLQSHPTIVLSAVFQTFDNGRVSFIFGWKVMLIYERVDDQSSHVSFKTGKLYTKPVSEKGYRSKYEGLILLASVTLITLSSLDLIRWGLQIFPFLMECKVVYPNFFTLLALASDLLNILSTLMSIHQIIHGDSQIGDHSRLTLAFSCMLCWFRLIEVVELLGPVYFSFFNTLSKSIPRTFPLLVSFLPIFVGYAAFGTFTMNETSSLYRNIVATGQNLFCVFIGDNILTNFYSFDSSYFAMGAIYIVTFIFFALFVWMNIIRSVIEEIFFEEHRNGQHAPHSLPELVKKYPNPKREHAEHIECYPKEEKVTRVLRPLQRYASKLHSILFSYCKQTHHPLRSPCSAYAQGQACIVCECADGSLAISPEFQKLRYALSSPKDIADDGAT